ncbi:AraC family transcriptional regulator [Microbulbifer magnicolonia]|uniref:AraC family transcriptional regulator n=1 Tax=Microbulbifer magnicolonia TaxID=3109744 RepID=UPI002B413D3A|nr:AraC family transcriptional regulator [Microbulbifer sp. GG15]
MASVIRASVLAGYSELVRDLGGDPAPLLEVLRIPADIVPSDNRLLPFRDSARLLELTAERLRCPDFALRLAVRQGVDLLGGIAVIACNSRTPREAVEDVTRFMPLHSPAIHLRLEPTEAAGIERLLFELADPVLSRLCQVQEQTLGNALGILRLLAGSETAPRRVFLPHAPLMPAQQYRAYFGCPVEFGQDCCAMELPTEMLDSPIATANPLTKQLAANYLERQFVSAAEAVSVQVRQLIRQLLPTGKYQIGVVAEHLCLHPRTLQRRLAEENLRFDALLDTVRVDLAAQYLADATLTLGQITGLLGYSEQSTFQRACQRWFGETPRNYRKRLVAGRRATAQLA